MSNVIEFPTETVRYNTARVRLQNRLSDHFSYDEILIIMDEVDEIINVSQFNLKEATEFLDSIDYGPNGTAIEIMGAINDN